MSLLRLKKSTKLSVTTLAKHGETCADGDCFKFQSIAIPFKARLKDTSTTLRVPLVSFGSRLCHLR